MDVATTPDWLTSGDITLEWNFPADWELWDGTEETMAGRYVSRLTFTTPPAAAKSCQYLQVYHTQYLTEIMANEKPDHVVNYLNRIYLSAGNNVNYSPPYRVTGWNEYDTEIFEEGGKSIQAMRSCGETLLVLKDSAIYGYFGNVWEDRYLKLLVNVGTVNGNTAKVIDGALFFLARDGFRYFYDANSKIISKHINTDVLSYTASNAFAVNYQGQYWCCFPSNNVMLWFDPDTYRVDDMGDGRVSFFKFTGITVSGMSWHYGGDDDGYLLGWQNIGGRIIKRLQNGNYYDGTSTDIATVFQSRDVSHDTPLLKKRSVRAKVDTSKSGTFAFRVYDEYSQNYVEATLDSGTGAGHFHYDISIPYTMDGMTNSYYLSNTGSVDVTIYGFAVETAGRVF